MMKILVRRIWAGRNIAALFVNFHSATNAHFKEEKTTKFPVGKLESLLRIVPGRIVFLARKKASSKVF